MSVLVFGGRSPIALALCNQLIASGCEVHLATRRIDSEIKKISSELKIDEVHQCDLYDVTLSEEFVTNLNEKTNGLLGIAFLHRYRSDTPDQIAQYAVEVLTPFRIIESLAQIPRQQELSVVLTSSPAANRVVNDQDFQYHASKAATEQLIRFSAVRFAKNKIRTNGINPGSFVYKERAANFYKENPQMLKDAENSVPLSRMAEVDEIAAVAKFLLGKESSYVNGEIIIVDGGRTNIIF